MSAARGTGHEELRNKTLWQVLDEVASRAPDKPAFVSVDTDGRERRVTYSELMDEARVLSAGFARLGLRRGDRVTILMTNLPEWIASYFAFLRIGVVGVPVNTWLKPPEIKYVIGQSRSRHLLILDRFRKLDFLSMLEEIAPEWSESTAGRLFSDGLPELRNVIIMKRDGSRYDGDNAFTFSDLATARDDPNAIAVADAMEADVRPDDLALVKYTSGSTGFPKGAMLEQGGIVANALMHTERLQVTDGDERWFSAMPFFHAGGSVWGLMTTLSRGSTLYFTEAFDPVVALDVVEREQCTAIFGVPAMLRDIATLIRGGGRDLSSVRIISASDPALADELRQLFPKLKLTINAFGLTESYGPASVTSPDDSLDLQRTTSGRFFDGVEWKVVDPITKVELGPGKVGEAVLRGPVMRGYWEMPDQTASAIDEQGWLHTEDLISVDESGYVSFVGRLKAMLKTGGENVAVEEVENCILGHLAVLECIVVGIPHPRKDQVGRAYVVPQPGTSVTAERLTVWCNKQLARFKVPAEFIFVDSLPRTGSDKIDRAAVQQMAQDSVQVAVDGRRGDT